MEQWKWRRTDWGGRGEDGLAGRAGFDLGADALQLVEELAAVLRTVRAALGAARRVHGGQFAVQDEAEPAVGAVGQLQRRRVAPNVQAVAAARDAPVAPVVRLPHQNLLQQSSSPRSS